MKQFVFRVGFATEIILFLFFYLFGSNSLGTFFKLKQENIELKQNISEKKFTLSRYYEEINLWKTNSFHKEKIAREKLQMKKKSEIIYFIPGG